MASNNASITLKVNGQVVTADVDVRWTLADFLRDQLQLVGTHLGCEHGVCGNCTVLVNGETVRSCLTLAVQCHHAEILTIEGLSATGSLHPMQEAFWESHAVQCGYCTPAMILASMELLQQTPQASRQQIRESLSGILCRCTGYDSIINAVELAKQKMAQGPKGEGGKMDGSGA